MLITTDGHRIDVMEKPVAQGERIRLHLAPGGEMALYPSKLIDWPATEKFNAPPPPPAPKPAPTAEPAVAPALGGATAGEVSKSGGVLELKLIGGGRARATVPGEGAAPAGARPADPNAAAGLLAALGREMADLRNVQAGLAASKARLEGELAQLQARAAKAPPQGLSNYESPTQKAIELTQQQLHEASDQLATVEKRISDIRTRAIDAGGSLD